MAPKTSATEEFGRMRPALWTERPHSSPVSANGLDTLVRDPIDDATRALATDVPSLALELPETTTRPAVAGSDGAWWRRGVVYQVYVRSFHDADGDGVGDLAGVMEKLPYLAELGVDGLWLNPFYPSPGHDHGYDVSDYCAVDPAYGNLECFDQLVDKAHALGLRVIIDVIPNHCSISHPWFQDALAAPAGSPERARFHFADGRGPDGDLPPNNWRSIFGGPAWARVSEPDGTPGQWYLHTFAAEQPDFNWDHPEVGPHFEKVLGFWFDRGVDGFRIDVAHGLHKAPGLPDHPHAADDEATGHPQNPNAWNQPAVHQVWRTWRALADSYTALDGRPRVLIGEVGLLDATAVADYQRDDELHQTFYFPFLHADFDATTLRTTIDQGLRATAGTDGGVTWVLNNHDMPRAVTRYAGGQPGATPGDTTLGVARARAAAALMLALPGATYLYQGEELGLPEVVDLPLTVLKDPMYHRSNGARRGRDGCRVPLPWANNPHHHGFSPPTTTTPPWLPQPTTWTELAVETQQATTTSTLHLYQQALTIRTNHPDLTTTTLTWTPTTHPGLLTFTRGTHFACTTNTTNHPLPNPHPHAQPLLTTHPTPHNPHTIPPNTTTWWQLDEPVERVRDAESL